MALVGARRRFEGRIAGVGSASGVRVVVGWWHESPFGRFADAMIERGDGHRILLAPTQEVADLVSGTYVFDEVRIEPVTVEARRGASQPAPGGKGWPTRAENSSEGPSAAGATWMVESPSLQLTLRVGDRTGVGHLLRLVPRPVATSPAWATAIDPVARLVMRGVRTRGVAREGRREYYGAVDAHAVMAVSGRLDGTPSGTWHRWTRRAGSGSPRRRAGPRSPTS